MLRLETETSRPFVRLSVPLIRSGPGQAKPATTTSSQALVARAPDREALKADLSAAADEARQAFSHFADWLETSLAPLAPSLDAVGEERYALDSRYFLGAVIDLEEAYQWGFEELHRIQQAQRAIAKDLVGESDIKEAYAALDRDPARRIAGAEAFRAWMQELADQAIS